MVRRAPRDVSIRLATTEVSVRLVPMRGSFGSSTRLIDVASEVERSPIYDDNFPSLVFLSPHNYV